MIAWVVRYQRDPFDMNGRSSDRKKPRTMRLSTGPPSSPRRSSRVTFGFTPPSYCCRYHGEALAVESLGAAVTAAVSVVVPSTVAAVRSSVSSGRGFGFGASQGSATRRSSCDGTLP